MGRNNDLQQAHRAKQDEFYTQLVDIELELKHYKKQFENKVVFCNCDDPYESNFFKYFSMNFNALHLKKLIATCYDSSPIAYTQISMFPDIEEKLYLNNNRHAYKIEICEVDDYNKDGAVDLSDVEYLLKNKKNIMTLLKGNGDFRSEECVDLLKQSDIVVTNPPFSLFREYIAQLVEYNKKFLIIGNVNAITYKEVFPLIKDNKLWLGCSIHSGDREFQVPSSYPLNAAGTRIDENGNKFIRVKGVRWFTNMDTPKRHEQLTLYKKYTPEEYPKYDNYDAIEVSKVADIPCDYFPNDDRSGDMGVPITYLDKYNPDQFEIVKFRKGNNEKDLTYTVKHADNFDRQTDRQTDRLRLISELSSVEKCNGIMGVPITFIDKYNPAQFEILGLANSAIWLGDFPCFTIINGRRIYNRIIIRRKM